MKYAILAAGEGSRLEQEGVKVPKPLVSISGEAMIDRLIRIFNDNDAEEIYVIANNLAPQTQQHLRDMQIMDSKLHIVVETTPSSMHSFHALSRIMGKGRFCLTTVDTIFDERDFAQYIRTFQESDYDGLMAVTDYIDDEKPLWIETDRNLKITAFLDQGPTKYISGGIYCLSDRVFPILDRCIANGMSRMRNFQRQLVAEGLRLKAYPFGKILDVDHAEDIAKAEIFLKGGEQ